MVLVLDCCCREDSLLLQFLLSVLLLFVGQEWPLNRDFSTPKLTGRDPHHLLGCLRGNPIPPPPPSLWRKLARAWMLLLLPGHHMGHVRARRNPKHSPLPFLSSWGHPALTLSDTAPGVFSALKLDTPDPPGPTPFLPPL